MRVRGPRRQAGLPRPHRPTYKGGKDRVDARSRPAPPAAGRRSSPTTSSDGRTRGRGTSCGDALPHAWTYGSWAASSSPGRDAAAAARVRARRLAARVPGAASGVPVPRQRVAFLLWPDSSEAQARTNLRHALTRCAAPCPTATSTATPDAALAHRRALRHSTWTRSSGRSAPTPRRAIEAYGGDLLDGTYDPWVLEERERLRDRYLDALERWPRTGDAALRYAEQLVRPDPLGEDRPRALMRLHDAAATACGRCAPTTPSRGRAARARRLPSAEMRGAYDALLLHAPAPAAARPRPPRGARGRARPPRRALALGQRGRPARAGHGRARDRQEPAGRGAALVVRTPARRPPRPAPTPRRARSPTARGRVAALSGASRRGCAGSRAHAAELAPLLPELRPPAPPPARSSAAACSTRGRGAADRGAPLLLVADDLQWVDAPRLQFLHYLLRSAPDAPLLVAATARREELDAGHPVAELVSALPALGRFSRSSSSGSAARRRACWPRACSGRRWTPRRPNACTPRPKATRSSSSRRPRRPPHSGGRVQAVIAARLARLSAPASELAGVAATVGREFSARSWPTRAPEAPALVRGLDELWRRGIVRAHGATCTTSPRPHPRRRLRRLGPARRRAHHLPWRVRWSARRRRTRRARRAVRGGGGARGRRPLVPCGPPTRRSAATTTPAPCRRSSAPSPSVRAPAEPRARRPRAGAADRAARPAERARRLPLRAPRPRARAGAGPRTASSAVEPEPPLVRSRAVAALTAGDFDAARAAGRAAARAPRRRRAGASRARGPRHRRLLARPARPPGAHLEAALARWRPEHRGEHLLRYGQDTELRVAPARAHALAARATATRRSARATPRSPTPASTRTPARSCTCVRRADRARRARRGAPARARPRRGGAAGRVGRDARRRRSPGSSTCSTGASRRGCDRIRRAADAAEHGAPAAPGERGLLLRILVEACTLGRRRGRRGRDRARPARRAAAQPWTAELQRLQQAFRGEERFGNGGIDDAADAR